MRKVFINSDNIQFLKSYLYTIKYKFDICFLIGDDINLTPYDFKYSNNLLDNIQNM